MLLISNLNLILAIIVSLKIPKLNGIQLGQWYNPINFIVLFHLIIHTLIGALLINNGFANNSVIHKVSNVNIYNWSNYIALSIYIYYITNYILIKYFINKQNFDQWINRRIVVTEKRISTKNLYNYLVILLAICCVVSVYVTIVSGGIPHLRIFTMNLLEFRFSISRGFPGIIYLKTIFFDSLPILLCCIFYSYYLTVRTQQTRGVFYLSFILASYSSTFTFEKSPFIVFILTLYIIKKIIQRRRIKPYYFLILPLLLFGFFSLLSSASASFIFRAIFNRIFIDQVSGSYLMFEIYPINYPFIGFSSISSLVEIFGLNYQFPARRIAMEYAFGERALSYMNLLSTYYLGEAYANFGVLGVILAPIYVCTLITTFYHKLIKTTKSPLIIAIFAYSIIPSSVSSQFNNFLYNSITIILFLLIITVFNLSKRVDDLP